MPGQAGSSPPPAKSEASLDPVADMIGEPVAPPVAPARPATPEDDTIWDWTSQYSKPGAPKQEEKEDARGFDQVGDPAGSPEDAAMAAMYVKPEKVEKAHNPDLTFTPRVLEKPFPWRWVVIPILLVVFAMIAAFAFVKVDSGDTDGAGQAIRRSFLEIIWMKISGFKEASADPEIMAYVATRDRIHEVQAAAYEYEKANGSFPTSIAKLIDAELIPAESSRDGWGHEFLIIPVTHRIVSSGLDGTPDTSDDIMLDPDQLHIPGQYRAYEVEKEGF